MSRARCVREGLRERLRQGLWQEGALQGLPGKCLLSSESIPQRHCAMGRWYKPSVVVAAGQTCDVCLYAEDTNFRACPSCRSERRGSDKPPASDAPAQLCQLCVVSARRKSASLLRIHGRGAVLVAARAPQPYRHGAGTRLRHRISAGATGHVKRRLRSMKFE